MRREWSGWIKTQNWAEFEREAKRDPSQSLADTVGELARGFPGKADQKALKRILYFLREKGYEPTPVEEPEAAPPPVKEPYRAAVMRSPEARGETTFMLGVEGRDRIRWLSAVLRADAGIYDAREFECTHEELDKFLRRQLRPMDTTELCALVPFEYAHSRVSAALTKTKHAPAAIAYWRTQLDSPAMPHPALDLPRTPVTDEEMRVVAIDLDQTYQWRLELGIATAPLMRYREAMRDLADKEELDRVMHEVMAEIRQTAFGPGVILEDHLTRLLDLGYLMHLNGMPDSGRVLGTYDDLQSRGPESPYAKGIIDKTITIFFESLPKEP